MTDNEKKSFRFWRKIYLAIITSVIFCVPLCSCEEIVSDGVVTTIDKEEIHSNYTFRVRIKKNESVPEAFGGGYYEVLTNDTLQVGDTIHIGLKY